MLHDFFIFCVALTSNFLSSLAGGGTGLLQLPALIWLGLPFSVALATHKVSTVAMGAGALFYAFKNKNLNRHIIILLLVAGIPGVILGSVIVLYIPERLGLFLLGFLNIMICLYSFFKKELGLTERKITPSRRHTLIGGTILFLIAVINGSLTVGTGLMVVLWLVRWYGIAYDNAVRHTLIVVGICWNFFGALSLALSGLVYWHWVLWLILGVLLGGWIGVQIAHKIGNKYIKRIFESSALIAGIDLLLKAF